MSHAIHTAAGERSIHALISLLLAVLVVGTHATAAQADTGGAQRVDARTAMILAEHGSAGQLGATLEWAWAQRLERELCARYGDASCSG